MTQEAAQKSIEKTAFEYRSYLLLVQQLVQHWLLYPLSPLFHSQQKAICSFLNKEGCKRLSNDVASLYRGIWDSSRSILWDLFVGSEKGGKATAQV